MAKDDVIETYLNPVKEIILDEDKLVTCTTISKELCIHINNSKKLLQSVVQDIRKKQPKTNLNVNFIVSGLLGDNNAQTKVCTEDDLDNIKKSFQIVFYDHIYSVCKGSSGVDNASHIMLTKFDDFNICPGLIKSSECIKRSTAEIGNLKTCSQEQITIESKPLVTPAKKSKQVTHDDSKDLKSKEIINNGVKEGDSKTNPVKSEPITPKKESTIKPTINKVNGHKTQKGIAGFFNKPNVVNKEKVSKDLKEIKTENISKEIKIENVSKETIQKKNVSKETIQEKNVSKETIQEKNVSKETTKDEEECMEVDIKPEKVLGKKKEIKKESKSNNKNELLNKIKKSSKVDKSRKRVLHVSDSDSDTENDPFVDKLNTNVDSMDQSDDEIPPTPSASIKITSGIVNPKKRRKIVDKTYTDEDGYILTKKEEVYESCSENEEEMKLNTKVKVEKTESPVKKNSPKSKKKISPPQKGKQATLTNFFKKV